MFRHKKKAEWLAKLRRVKCRKGEVVYFFAFDTSV
jgi:hypothetical protein